MDQLNVDFEQLSGLDPLQQDWTLPTEAFQLRHEIEDRSPPPEQFPNHCSPDMVDGETVFFFLQGQNVGVLETGFSVNMGF